MKILIMRMFILGALLCLAPISFAKPIDVPQLIKARLLYMKDVALYKAKRNLAIENTDREVKVLAKAKAKATELGLAGDSIEAFFRVQINAAKAIQYRYRAQWLFEPAALGQKSKDLQRVVRPVLLMLGDEIIVSIAQYIKNFGAFKEQQRDEFVTALDVKHLAERDKHRLYDALLLVRLQL